MSQIDPVSVNQIAMNVNQSMKSFYVIFADLGIIIPILIKPVVNIFFAWTCYETMKKIPQEEHVLPNVLCWLFLIPLAGYIFQWMMLPFAIPKTLKKFQPENKELQKSAKFLFIVGLIYLILELGIYVPGLFLLSLIPWIIYWVKIKNIRALIN